MAYIYAITNNINEKQYVGKTNNSVDQRFQEHIRDSKKERCEKRPLYDAMNKYGIENFSISILEECSAEESADKEIYWIGRLDTYGSNGYNATLGGDSKKYYDYQKLADAYLKLGTLKAVCEKFGCDIHTARAACKDNDIKIKSGQEWTKVKFSKSVVMLDKKTNEEIKTFSSLSDAAIYVTGESKGRSHIADVCNGRRKSAYGYKWKFC